MNPKPSTARAGHTYRSAKRNRARALGLDWRALPRRKTHAMSSTIEVVVPNEEPKAHGDNK